MLHALRHWPQLARWLRAHPRLLLLCDYDGSLVPIRPTPEEATLDGATRSLLLRLSRAPGLRVGLVSGRALPVLRRLVRVPGLFYAGNHGLEVAGQGLRFTHPGARRAIPRLSRIARELRRTLRGIPGAWVEHKRLTLSVHWRLVAARDADRFHRALGKVLQPWVARRLVRVTRGKRVVEIRPPVAWDKGAAVTWLLARGGGKEERVWYCGDDRTDEDAFQAVNRRRGIALRVGHPAGRTAARWWVRTPQELQGVLRYLEQARWNSRPTP